MTRLVSPDNFARAESDLYFAGGPASRPSHVRESVAVYDAGVYEAGVSDAALNDAAVYSAAVYEAAVHGVHGARSAGSRAGSRPS